MAWGMGDGGICRLGLDSGSLNESLCPSFFRCFFLSFSYLRAQETAALLTFRSALCIEQLAAEVAAWAQARPRRRELGALFSVLRRETTHRTVGLTAIKALFGIQWQHQFMSTQREKCRLI